MMNLQYTIYMILAALYVIQESLQGNLLERLVLMVLFFMFAKDLQPHTFLYSLFS